MKNDYENEYMWGLSPDDDDLYQTREEAVWVAKAHAKEEGEDSDKVVVWRFKRPYMPPWYLNACDAACVNEPPYFPDRSESPSGEVWESRNCY